MPKVFDRAADFIFWHRRLLDIGGLWPMEPCGLKFYTLLAYCTVHLFMAFAHLASVFGNLERMIENMGETALLIMIIAKMVVLKFSILLRKTMREVTDFRNEDEYESSAEKRIYISYVSDSLRFFKLNLRVTIMAGGGFYLKTMITILIAEMLGKPTDFIMPYHIKFFINITDYTTYALVCAYQTPMIYVFTCHSITACFMWSLVTHVCAQLSVLAFRIKNIKATSSIMDNRTEISIRRIVRAHHQIIRTSTALDDVFNIILLDEIVICSVVVGLCIYNVLVNTSVDGVILFITYILFISAMLIETFGWCLTGDFLTQESLKVLEAWYECEWYDMPSRCQKLVIMSMIRAHSPLHITAGGFYIYSLESFTNVVKSSMVYASMLRAVVGDDNI